MTGPSVVSPRGSFRSFVYTMLGFLSKMPRDVRDHHAMHVGMDAAPTGLWMEFGVFQGNTLIMMAQRHAPQLVHGFDSFRGLPEKWRNVTDRKLLKYTEHGAFDMGGRPPSLDVPNVVLHKGWFNESLPRFLQDHPGEDIAFLHVDSDLYSSAKLVLAQCLHRMKNGSVLVFDELVNFPAFEAGELRALYDVFEGKGYSFELLGHSLTKVVASPHREHWPQAVAMRLLVAARDEAAPPSAQLTGRRAAADRLRTRRRPTLQTRTARATGAASAATVASAQSGI